MKTVQKGTEIERVKDAEADFLVSSRGYKFVPKSAWKALRPAKEVKQTSEAELKEETPKEEKKKKSKKGE